MALADKATQVRWAVAGSARNRRNTSMPSKSGNCMSTSTSAGCSARAIATPLLPLTAPWNSYCVRCASNSLTIIMLTALSSM